MKSGPPLVQIVNVEDEFHSFACRLYAPPSSCVTLLFGPPPWFVVQSVMPEGGGVDAGGVVTGAWVVVVALGAGVGDWLGDEDGLVTGLELALGVGVTEDSTLGARFGEAVGDGRVEADGLDSEPGANVGPEIGLADPSSLTWLLDTTSAFSSAGIHELSIDVACGA